MTMPAAAPPRRRFDPIAFQVLWSRMVNMADEMATVLVKTSFSHVVRDNHDYACALYDAEGRMLAQSNQCTPGQLGAMPIVMQDFLKEYPRETLAPGDVLITNDPWLGSGHTPDIFIATPIFRHGQLVGFAVNSAHHIDIGGRLSAPDAQEVYEEGIILPIAKLYDRGKPNEDLFRILRRNVRLADKVIGDIRAQLAANHSASKRMLEFLEEMRLEGLSDLADDIMDHSEASMRQAIAEVPEGSYAHALQLEDVDRSGKRLDIKVRVDVKGGEMFVDFAGTSPQVPLPINSVYNITYAYTVFPIKSALHPHIPNNAGCARPIHLSVPEGTLLNARFPVAVMWRTSLVYFAVEAIFGALAKAIPEKVMAPSGTYPLWIAMFSGEFDDGRPFKMHFNAQGGQGARYAMDGLSTTVYPPNVANTPVELLESETPLLCERKSLIPDSGGAGKFRGGCGQEIVIRNRSSRTVRSGVVGGRFRHPATGLHGGGPGANGSARINDGEPLQRSQQLELGPGDAVHMRYPGGGGFGAPFERDPERVLDDVRRGLVSPERARSDYGVALLPDRRGVDTVETERLRTAKRN
jgi:N-methylhydantoinase B